MPQKSAAKKQAKPKKHTGGRVASPLTERNQVRNAPGEWSRWQAVGLELGFGGASPLIRKLANEFCAAHDAKKTATPSS